MKTKSWLPLFLSITAALMIGFSSIVNAAVLFSDNFDNENGGNALLNFNSFTNWNVTGGTVDLIGNGGWDFYPGNGLYVDLDGSTGWAGILITKMIFAPGQYLLSFNLGNSPYGGTNTIEIALGNWHTTLTRNPGDPLQPFSFTTTASGALSFHNLGGDNIGAILDNVQVASMPTPEPSTWLLMGMGIAGAGAYRLRKKSGT
jgi:hypothetical protein